MNTHPSSMRSIAALTILTLAAGLGACSGMSRQDQNTAIGAGAGAVGGSVLTGGSTIGTLGGAAIGGYIGNQVDTNKK
ncbi:MAG: glycine zipper 2TM domain-containing protein [Hydrogenophaga sp.]|jgi:osmotically inducible lipoprotein OsmB|nr:glycine zipper 2TM domain-containing protein [Hydrogenophaga sp.]MDZ4361391.1 glycine zipper 2TM domain-containing protein [Variovorax sp.]